MRSVHLPMAIVSQQVAATVGWPRCFPDPPRQIQNAPFDWIVLCALCSQSLWIRARPTLNWVGLRLASFYFYFYFHKVYSGILTQKKSLFWNKKYKKYISMFIENKLMLI